MLLKFEIIWTGTDQVIRLQKISNSVRPFTKTKQNKNNWEQNVQNNK